jgi:UDP-2-acetamido-2,6-beta-L-arabino-hexul-4-ose reductase
VNVAITGAYGFLGWHLSCRLRALRGIEPLRLGRSALGDPDELERVLSDVDAVVHVAGTNRAATDAEVVAGNVEAAEAVAAAMRSRAEPLSIVYADSTQSRLDNAYGHGKAAARDILDAAARDVGGPFADVVLPNLFGEHGTPHYNSYVATFCHLVATGRAPKVTGDREVPLLHVQHASQALIDALDSVERVHEPKGRSILISEVLARVQSFHATYSHGDIPDLTDPFDANLFNTYRSYVFPDSFPRYADVHTDARGELFETSRSRGGTSQAFVSITRPGQSRGDHYHLTKIERFFVVSGEAEIALRRLLGTETTSFRLSGDRPGYVDMPTLWTHNIRNVGDSDLVTTFWSDQLLDPTRPDQFAEPVDVVPSP